MKKSWVRKGLAIGIIMLFVGTSVLPCDMAYVNEKKDLKEKENSFSNWDHNVSLTISPPTPVIDYQVKIELDPSKFDYSLVNPDGSDLRFTDTEGKKLNYWIEEWHLFGISVIWVKVPQIGTTTINMHYGNLYAKSESNGDETFIFFDDFFTYNSSRWESWTGYEPTININDGEIAMTEKWGGSANLYSKTYIPIETRTRYRIKQRNDGPNPPAGLGAGLSNMSKNALGDYIWAAHEWWFSEWWFSTGCNGTGNTEALPDINTAELSQYYIDEYIWTHGKVEYYYNWKLKHIKTSNISYNPMNLKFNIAGENTLICDWVMVTKYFEEPSEVILFDDFDDNIKNFSKWTEISTNGTWDETNKRTEFTLYEHPGGGTSREGIESSVFNASLNTNESVIISWYMNTDIGSSKNCWSGSLSLEVIDQTNENNYIQTQYNRGKAATIYSDSTIPYNNTRVIRYYDNRYDGSWDNEIQIFSDRYHIVMNNESSGWIYHPIFPTNAVLKLRISIDNTGAMISTAYMKVAFDNIKVEIPEHGKQAPYPPRIEIVGVGIRYNTNPALIPLKKYQINISATDPDFDDVTLYIESKNNVVGEWTEPVPSSQWQEMTQSWKHGQYSIRIKAIDSHGYESILKEQVIKVSWFWWFINLITNIISFVRSIIS